MTCRYYRRLRCCYYGTRSSHTSTSPRSTPLIVFTTRRTSWRRIRRVVSTPHTVTVISGHDNVLHFLHISLRPDRRVLLLSPRFFKNRYHGLFGCRETLSSMIRFEINSPNTCGSKPFYPIFFQKNILFFQLPKDAFGNDQLEWISSEQSRSRVHSTSSPVHRNGFRRITDRFITIDILTLINYVSSY